MLNPHPRSDDCSLDETVMESHPPSSPIQHKKKTTSWIIEDIIEDTSVVVEEEKSTASESLLLSSPPARQQHKTTSSDIIEDDIMIEDTSVVKKRRTSAAKWWRILTKLLLLPVFVMLLAAWTGLLATYAAHHLYHNYYHPMVVATRRAADDAVVRQSDSTYYNRMCTSQDMSVWEDEAHELLLAQQDGLSPVEQQEAYVDQMMKHGVGVIPELLTTKTTENLRNYIVGRNQGLSDSDSINISPNFMRQAFAIDPAEDLAVQAALHELASNAILKATVSGIVGDDDPAITEMSSLTSYTGAEGQKWHHDVLADRGSAVQYARTYSHTYSLFIALQETPSYMGATRICPGSHMCGIAQGEICDTRGFQPLLFENAHGEPVWRAGDGVIFNQQLCHKGEAHTWGRERIMFVVSFTARPKLGLDSRVLSRGLYCFSLWRIWGLTWQDLYFSAVKHTTDSSLRTLRSLGVWKPGNRNWGLDFVTKSIMEWNLRENGMETYMLSKYANEAQHAIGFPKFLHGHIYKFPEGEDDDYEPEQDVYHDYIESTLGRCVFFFIKVNAGLVALLGVPLLGISVFFGGKASVPFRSLNWTVLAIYAVPALIMFQQLRVVKKSDWGRNIQAGTTFREPFPSAQRPREEVDNDIGPTTLPERTDVLIGTRFDSSYLGGYAQWVRYHPGNIAYQEAVQTTSKWLPSYKGLPDAFQKALVDQVTDSVSGRMLKQDWQTGNWMVLPASARDRRIHRNLVLGEDIILSTINTGIDILLATNRFDVVHRDSTLGFEAQRYLHQMRDILLPPFPPAKLPIATRQAALFVRRVVGVETVVSKFGPTHQITALSPTMRSRDEPPASTSSSSPSCPKWSNPPVNHEFRIGDTVLVYTGDNYEPYVRGTIFQSEHDDEEGTLYDIAYENAFEEYDMPHRWLLPVIALEEGMELFCRSSTQPLVIKKIKPNGQMDVELPDKSILFDINPKDDCKWWEPEP